jgi:hypothetical protein
MRYKTDRTSYLRLENSIICERQYVDWACCSTPKDHVQEQRTHIQSIIVSHSRPQTDHLTTCLAVEYCCVEAHVAEEPSERVGGHTNSGSKASAVQQNAPLHRRPKKHRMAHCIGGARSRYLTPSGSEWPRV